MLVTFTRKRLMEVIDALENGSCVVAPKIGKQWPDSDILAIAGACMSELMFRREVKLDETTDDPLRFHLHRTYDRLSGRMTAALHYALSVASNITCGRLSAGYEAVDKTYEVQIEYDHGAFAVRRRLPLETREEADAADAATN